MNWIRVEKDTPKKTQIVRIAMRLGISKDEAFGLCVRFWMWADDETDDGFIAGATLETIDMALDRPGFGEALAQDGVAWAIVSATGIRIPGFTRHMGESAKRRSMDSERQNRRRNKDGKK